MYRIIVVIVVALALLRLITRFRHREITTTRFIAWLAVWVLGVAVPIFVLSFYPDLSRNIAQRLGIARGLDLFFFFALLLLLYLLFNMHLRIDRLQREITELVRLLALKNEKKDF